MKKSLLIALVGIVLFALTSCGGSSSKGTKEFKDAKALVEKFDKQVSNAKTCDELQTIVENMTEEAEAMEDITYAEAEQLTPEEEEILNELVTKMTENFVSKTLELECFE